MDFRSGNFKKMKFLLQTRIKSEVEEGKIKAEQVTAFAEVFDFWLSTINAHLLSFEF